MGLTAFFSVETIVSVVVDLGDKRLKQRIGCPEQWKFHLTMTKSHVLSVLCTPD